MKITCDVIKDLLPLYVEEISREDTRILVEEHVNSCDRCKQELNKMNTPKEISINANVLPLKKLKRTLLKRKYVTILFSVSLTILVLVITMGYLTTPEYIPYSKSPITMIKTNNNSVIVHFEVPGTRYETSKYRVGNNSGYIYNISIWSSIWNRKIYKDTPQDIILNPNGEMVSSVYFSSNDGSDDVLIYGKNQNPNGGRITLPRLVLAYYVSIAIKGSVILGIILFVFRKKQNIKVIVFKLFALPISYLLGHICIKGFTFISYSAARDFYTILLAMIVIYCSVLLGYNLLTNGNSK